MVVDVVVALVITIAVLWLCLVLVLVVARPSTARLRGTVRVVPDTIRLVRRLAADPSVHRGVRLRLWLLLAYLVSPIDLVPDFIPVIGYADDAIVIALVLRSVVRRAGAGTVRLHWPGSDEGLDALGRLCHLDLRG